jgi:hypothetical protein
VRDAVECLCEVNVFLTCMVWRWGLHTIHIDSKRSDVFLSVGLLDSLLFIMAAANRLVSFELHTAYSPFRPQSNHSPGHLLHGSRKPCGSG